ncbi:hypothetical protein Tco_1396464 [Tanacetum coccineum]
MKDFQIASKQKNVASTRVRRGIADASSTKADIEADEDSESDVEDIYDESGDFMAVKHSTIGSGSGSGIRNKSLYEHWNDTLDDDPYDDDYHNAYDLTGLRMAFCDALDIKLHGRIK